MKTDLRTGMGGALLIFTLAVASVESRADDQPVQPENGHRRVVNLRRDPAASQDAALKGFVEDLEQRERATLILVETTVEGDRIEYTVDTQPAAGGKTDARIVLDARKDRYWGRDSYRVYEIPAVAVTLTAVPVSPANPLTPAAGARRRASVAVRVLRGSAVVFDSAAGYPVTDGAAAWRKE